MTPSPAPTLPLPPPQPPSLSLLLLLLLPAAALAHAGGGAGAPPPAPRGLSRAPAAAAAGFALAANASLVADGGFVAVSFSAQSPAAGDWIGAFAPAGADPLSTVPVKWLPVGLSAKYRSTGAGTAHFQLVDVRADFAFHYFTGGWRNGSLVASAAGAVAVEGAGAAPRRARVLASGDASNDALRLVWTASAAAAAGGSPRVLYGSAPDKLFATATAAAATPLQRSDLCGPPANDSGFSDLGVTLSASLTGLQGLAAQSAGGQRRVFYRFGQAASDDNLSDVRWLRVPSSPGLSFPTRVFVVGDLGRGTSDFLSDGISTWSSFGPPEYSQPALNSSRAMLADAIAADVDAFWLIGDLNYASGFLSVWDLFLFMIEGLAGHVATAVTLGNHEQLVPFKTGDTSFAFDSNDSGGECGRVSAALMPLPGTAGAVQSWYSWSVGPVAMVALASEVDFSQGSPQWLWLNRTLAAIDRAVTPFVLVSCHRPMYIDSTYGEGQAPGANPSSDTAVAAALLLHVEPLLMRYKVTAMVGGHNHAVQRHAASYEGQAITHSAPATLPDGSVTALFAQPRATVHFVWGTGGAGYTKNAHDAATRPAWSEIVFYEHGYGRVVAENASALHFEWVRGSDGTVLDRATIVQDLAQPWAGEDPPPAANGDNGPAPSSLYASVAGGVLSGSLLVAAAGVAVRRGLKRPRGVGGLGAPSDYEPVAVASAGVEPWRGGSGPRR